MSKQCPFSYIEFADLNFGRVRFHPSTRKTCEKAAPFPESVPHALHQKIRAPHCGTRIFGGDEEDLNSGFAPTGYFSAPLHAKPVKRLRLFQSPFRMPYIKKSEHRIAVLGFLVETKRIELSTLRMRTVRSPS